MKLHIGIDDTDSKNRFCTTYLGSILSEKLKEFSELEELRLVRLNPNIPWKTRGNGAVCIVIETEDYSRALEESIKHVEKYSDLEEEGTNPGLAILKGNGMTGLKGFYYKALRGIVYQKEAEKLAGKLDCQIYKFNNGRGIIGALASIGADLTDHTFELITYRKRENWGKKRRVNKSSVYKMDRATRPMTYNNIDSETKKILITPGSPCPVLYGIRGFNKKIVKEAGIMVETEEQIDRVSIFKSNQGTDAHLESTQISRARPMKSVIVMGFVICTPKSIKGGHIIFQISWNGSTIYCAAYEPTGSFRDIVKCLRSGDLIKAYGGVRNGSETTINLEKIEVINIHETLTYKNPLCPTCNKRMKSSGNGQGFRCKRCKTKEEKKEITILKRDLKTGLYGVPEGAMRHLSKPLII